MSALPSPADRIVYVIPSPSNVRFGITTRGFRLAEFVIPTPEPVVDRNTFSMRVTLDVPAEATAEEVATCLENAARAIRTCGSR